MPLYEHTSGERIFIPVNMVQNDHFEYLRLRDSAEWTQIGRGPTPDPVPETAEVPKTPEGNTINMVGVNPDQVINSGSGTGVVQPESAEVPAEEPSTEDAEGFTKPKAKKNGN